MQTSNNVIQLHPENVGISTQEADHLIKKLERIEPLLKAYKNKIHGKFANKPAAVYDSRHVHAKERATHIAAIPERIRAANQTPNITNTTDLLKSLSALTSSLEIINHDTWLNALTSTFGNAVINIPRLASSELLLAKKGQYFLDSLGLQLDDFRIIADLKTRLKDTHLANQEVAKQKYTQPQLKALRLAAL